MARILRYNVDNDIEKRILTGLIVNDEFCTNIQKMIKKQYFQIDHVKTVVGWVQDYYKAYKKAPAKQIQDIFVSEKASLKDADAELIGRFLLSLSQAYEDGGSAFNYEYLLDQSRDYFRERSLTMLAEKIQGELARGKVDQAELEVKNFSRVVKELGTWINPFEKTNIHKLFSTTGDYLLSLPDELGTLSGDLEREWLIAFMGPMKRGKSWMLQEFAIHALSCRLKVVYFSLEMGQRAMSKRIYSRLTGLAEKTGLLSYPVFDCERNQDNTCKLRERASAIGVKAPGEEILEYKKVRGYKPCTFCRPAFGEKPNSDYVQAVWKIWREQREEIDSAKVIKKVRDFERLYGSNFRIKSYPSFTATLDDIVSDLDDLWYTEEFVPDVICIDSLDITRPEGSANLSERGQIDWSWKRAKGLAGERHALVATVLQSNRPSITQKSIQQDNVGEDIRKLAHVDIMFGLNQTPAEKEKGIMRISTVAHRHRDFQFGKEVMVLQALDVGQPILDTQWSITKKDEK